MKFQVTELSRRGVFKTLAAYAVTSWVLIEVTSVIAPAFLLPGWTVAAVTTVFVLGAFPALVLTWRYDFTREGIKRDTSHVPDEVDRAAKRVSIVLLLLLLTVTSVLWVNYFRAQSVGELDSLSEAQQGAPEIGEDGLIQSVAVLPFDDFSPNESRKFLADGIAEAILHVLAQNKDLMVTARASSFYFRDKDATVAEIGRILNVQAVLEGSVQIVNEQLRVTSQLVRTSDQMHIWSNVYEAPLEGIFRIQDTIANTVRDLILAEGQRPEERTADKNYPSVEAYRVLLEARNLLDSGDRASNQRAIALLRMATDMEPDYADAHYWLGEALREASMGHGKLLRLAEEANDNTLRINPDHALALLMSTNYITWSPTIEESSQRLSQETLAIKEKVLTFAPNDPEVLLAASGISSFDEDRDKRKAEHDRLIHRARTVDPSNYKVFESYLGMMCEIEGTSRAVMVDIQLQTYQPPSYVAALKLRQDAASCDGDKVAEFDFLIQRARLESDEESALRALLELARLGQPEALRQIYNAQLLLPESFPPDIWSRDDDTIFFGIAIEDRLQAYRLKLTPSMVDSVTATQAAHLQILMGDYEGAEDLLRSELEKAPSFDSVEVKGSGGLDPSNFMAQINMLTDKINMLTERHYALYAWLKFQAGDIEEAKAVATELHAYSEQKGHQPPCYGPTSLLVTLLNGRKDEALKCLLDAEQDQWMGFQILLTSPVFEDFREDDRVAAILSRLVFARDELLDNIKALGLPEVSDPNLLLRMIEDRVNPP